MELIVQPADGVTTVINAVKKAKSSVELTIFRFDMKELQKALEDEVWRRANGRFPGIGLGARKG